MSESDSEPVSPAAARGSLRHPAPLPQHRVGGHQMERCTFAEIRLRLFKVAGRIEVLKTKVRLHLSAALKTTQRLIWQRCGSPARSR
ncbi:MAG: hypothetical protein R3F19_17795 [Verrucomicrobiales bacterium]